MLYKAEVDSNIILKELDALSDLVKHVKYYAKCSTDSLETNFSPKDHCTLQPGGSEFVCRLSKELQLEKDVCYELLRTFFSSRITQDLSSTAEPTHHLYDDALVENIRVFKASEEVYTLLIWELLFKLCTVDEPYSESILIWAQFKLGNPSEFILSLLTLINTNHEESALNALVFMLFNCWRIPSPQIFETLKSTLITRSTSALRVLVILTAMQIDTYITNSPEFAMAPCHPVLDLVSTCVQVLNEETQSTKYNYNQVTINKGIAWISSSKFSYDITQYAKTIFDSILQLLTFTYTETAPFLPLLLSIHKGTPHLAEPFWDNPLNLPLLDVWKCRFPVCCEIISALDVLLTTKTAMAVFDYFDRLSNLCGFEYGVESNGMGGFAWGSKPFLESSKTLNIHPRRGNLVTLVGSENMNPSSESEFIGDDVYSVNVECSGWILCLALLNSFQSSHHRSKKYEYAGPNECKQILDLFANMFNSLESKKMEFFEFLPGFQGILFGVIKKAISIEDCGLVSSGINCLRVIKLHFSFSINDIETLILSEQKSGTYILLLSFLNYMDIINPLPFLPYLKELFQLYETWKYIDINEKYKIGTRILEITSTAGFPLRINVSQYFTRISGIKEKIRFDPNDTYLELFVQEALTHGTGGIFTHLPKLEIAHLALKSATLENLPDILKLTKFFPRDVAKCLRRFCESGVGFKECLAFSLQNPIDGLSIMGTFIYNCN